MSFSADLTRIVKKAGGNVDLVVRKTTADLFSSVIKKTPVDTGRARGNWNASTGSYDSGYDSDAQDRSGAGAIAGATSVANTAKAGGITYLVNSLPYIKSLEYGSSKQAPVGMVRITAEEFQQHLQSNLRAVK